MNAAFGLRFAAVFFLAGAAFLAGFFLAAVTFLAGFFAAVFFAGFFLVAIVKPPLSVSKRVCNRRSSCIAAMNTRLGDERMHKQLQSRKRYLQAFRSMV